MNDLILDFPILKKDNTDFNNDILYEVRASHNNDKLTITHTLTGQSFIRQLVLDKQAKFSISLYYKNSSERQNHIFDDEPLNENNKITASQTIDNEFSYAPEIIANIVIINDENIIVDDSSGLSDFWQKGSEFTIPSYARIAYYPTLNFNDGSVSNLIRMELAEQYDNGTLKVSVSEKGNEGLGPVKVLCAPDVYDELNKVTQAESNDAQSAMRLAIVTQILCAVYGYVANIDKEDDEIHSGLLAHLSKLKEKTGEDWEDDNFNPSLAATKMQPYAIKALKNNEEDDD